MDLSAVEVLVVGMDEPGLVVSNELVQFIPTRSGASAAFNRNKGMQEAKGDLLVFLDSDCIPRSDWLARHLYRHACGEKVVGGAITFDSHNRYQLADNVSAFHNILAYSAAGPRYNLGAANLSMRSEVREAVGDLLPYLKRAEDLEWCVRIRRHGYRLYFEPSAIVTHDQSRCDLASLWRHWVEDAHDTLWVRLSYAQSLKTPYLARFRWLYFLCAPLISAWSTRNTFVHSETRSKYWSTLPLVYLTKIFWCWGAFRHFPSFKGGRPD